MSKKTWIIFVVVCVALFGGLIYMSQRNKIDVSNIDVNAIQKATDQNGNIGDHVSGNAKSTVKFIEYGDYQCPYCGQVNPQVQQVMEKYKDQVAYIFRNFPITTIHSNALAAAAAAEAAGLQGKYWPMHEKLYDTQNEWASKSGNDRTNTFINYAADLGISTSKFKDTLDSPRIAKKIEFDRAIAKKLGVTSTPSFYLNGEKISDSIAQSLMDGKTEKLDAKISAFLKKKNIPLPESDKK